MAVSRLKAHKAVNDRIGLLANNRALELGKKLVIGPGQNTLKCEKIKISLLDANSSALIEDELNDQALYVVMPMRL